jgi:hypothetical protein
LISTLLTSATFSTSALKWSLLLASPLDKLLRQSFVTVVSIDLRFHEIAIFCVDHVNAKLVFVEFQVFEAFDHAGNVVPRSRRRKYVDLELHNRHGGPQWGGAKCPTCFWTFKGDFVPTAFYFQLTMIKQNHQLPHSQ